VRFLRQQHEEPQAPVAQAVKKPPFLSRKAMYGFVFLSMLTLAGMYYLYARFTKPSAKKVFLSGKYLKGFAPLTSVFNYDVSGIESDSVYINFGGDFENILLPKDKKTITVSYTKPGLYEIRIFAGRKTMAFERAHIMSRDWEGTVYHENGYYYLKDKNKLIHDGSLHLVPGEAEKGGIDIYMPHQKRSMVEYNHIQDYKVDGDNFSLETRIKNSPEEGGVYCYNSYIRVRGWNYGSRVSFTQPGCNSEAFVQFGEVLVDGKYTDLSSLGQDLSTWRVVKLVVKHKRAQVYIDNRPIFTTTYQNNIGPIKGITYRFKGYGSVDYLKLYNEKNELVYEDTFDQALPAPRSVGQ
jgi:hypothetical protein